MYIEIGDSIGSLLASSEIDENTLYSIQSILGYATSSAKEGKHCVKTASRECARKIATFFSSSPNMQKKFFNYIYLNFSTYLAGLKESIDSYIVIENIPERIIKDGKKIIVNVNFAARIEFWNPVCFLPENIIDRRYFLRIAYYEKEKHRNLAHIEFSLNPDQGAGGRTIDTYKCRCDDEKFILAVLDTDRVYPGQPLIPGSNAEQFTNLNVNDFPTGSIIILNVHEMENLFSSDEFINCAGTNNARQFLQYNLSPETRQYYDFKNGFAYNRLMHNEYMKRHVESAGIEIETCRNASTCSNQSCNSTSMCFKNCEYSIVVGAGKSFLKDIFGNDENESKEQIKIAVNADFSGRLRDAPENLIAPIKEEWLKLYRAFLTWFCSYKQEVYVS